MSKDYTKFSINGIGALGKSNLVLELIKKYISEKKEVTYKSLAEIFNGMRNDNYNVVLNEVDYQKFVNNRNDLQRRYFDPIDIEEDKIYICNQWGVNQTQSILDKAKVLGYDVSPIIDEDVDFSILSKQDIIEGIEWYDRLKKSNTLDKKRSEKGYYLLWKGEEYPHKYVFGLAYAKKTGMIEPLESSKYHSTGKTKYSAKKILDELGFVVYAQEPFRSFLEKDIKQNTANTYSSGLKLAIKIIQGIDAYSDLSKKDIIDMIADGKVDGQLFERSMSKKDHRDDNLYRSMGAYAIKYKEFLNNIDYTDESSEDNNKGYDMNKVALNTILFGPPGTGKTYNTINHALSILMGKKIDELPTERSKLINLYREYITNGQIVFTTFHQSYGYEEFIEGIKPDIDASENGEVRYKVEDGVFKSLCKTAISKAVESNASSFDEKKNKVWKFSLGSSQNGEDEVYYEEALKTESIILGWGDKIDFSSCSTYDEILEKANKDSSTARFVNIFIHEMKVGDIAIISHGNRAFKAIVEIVGDYFYDAESDLPQKRKIKWLKRFDTPRPYSDVSDKYFTQATINRPNHINFDKLKHLLIGKEVDNSKKNFVIIIDEINRGNISKIFGELITLIEPSKRIGAEEALRVSLPYSGNKFDGGKGFGVPSNVYIIGTMNTADRSIALMDTALRRRFEFIEMMPDYKVLSTGEFSKEDAESDQGQENDLKVGDINIRLLLMKINERISYLYDRDHQIGHAYFIGIKDIDDLNNVFKNKIIPLLQEYFYDDWEKIQIVLGDHAKQFSQLYKGKQIAIEKDRFILSEAKLQELALGFTDYNDEIEDKKIVYRVNESFTPEAYLKITGQLKSEITVNDQQTSQ